MSQVSRMHVRLKLMILIERTDHCLYPEQNLYGKLDLVHVIQTHVYMKLDILLNIQV